jgi:hypothetical protein
LEEFEIKAKLDSVLKAADIGWIDQDQDTLAAMHAAGVQHYTLVPAAQLHAIAAQRIHRLQHWLAANQPAAQKMLAPLGVKCEQAVQQVLAMLQADDSKAIASAMEDEEF